VFLGSAVSGILFAGDSWWMIWLFVPLSTFFMVPDFITPDGTLYPGMEGVTWSLFVEWIAYLAYASGAFRFKTSTLLTVAIFGWALMAVAGYYTGEGWGTGGSRSTLFTIGMLRCIPAFATGVVIYRIHQHPFFQRLPVVHPGILFAAWVAISALPASGPTPTLDAVVVIVCCPVLIMLLIRSDHKAPAICRRLGDMSYPLYVAHPGIILLAHYTSIFGHRFDAPHPLDGLLVVGLCIAFAWMIMKTVARISTFRSIRDLLWNLSAGGIQRQTMARPG
jgi:peptidoglycan/LPS O-acetylase OafA/YrhL